MYSMYIYLIQWCSHTSSRLILIRLDSKMIRIIFMQLKFILHIILFSERRHSIFYIQNKGLFFSSITKMQYSFLLYVQNAGLYFFSFTRMLAYFLLLSSCSLLFFIFLKRRLTCFAFSECMLTCIPDAYTVYGSYIKIPQCMLVYPKKLYTLERKPPSAFVRPVVGEGLCSLTDFVQNSQRG